MDNKRKQTSILSFAKKVRTNECNERNDGEVSARDESNSASPLAQCKGIEECSSSGCGMLADNPPKGNPYDIAHFLSLNSKLSTHELLDVLNNLWSPESNYKFPVTQIKGKNLKFQKHWFEKWHWLCYSEIMDGAYCKYCALFSPSDVGMYNNQTTGKLVSQAYRTWNHAIEQFEKHSKLKYHQKCLEACSNLKKIKQKVVLPIAHILDKNKVEEISRNRKMLSSVIKTVMFCGKQGIPLRGHLDYGPLNIDEEPEQNEGNFRALLRMRIEAGDETLKHHLKYCGRNSYISWRTQNEIISAINEIILKDIAISINESECFSILADETTDVSGVEQFSLVARFIKDDFIHEQFLQFIPVVSTTGKSLATHLIDSLKSFNINLKYLRGQGYDGASAMSGEFQGVQAHIKKEYPLALYVQCSSHSLNLAISDACNIPEIRNCIGIVGKTYDFFHTPKRQHVLIENIHKYCPNSRKQKLVQMCSTRWIERHDSVNVMLELFDAIHASLGEISEWCDKDTAVQATLLNLAISKADFIISLLIISKLFVITKKLCEYLQTVNSDLKKSMNYADSVIEVLEEMNANSETTFNEIFQSAIQLVSLTAGKQEQIKIPRCTAGKRSHYRNNVPAASPEEYYRRALFLPFLGSMVTQIKHRLQKHNNILAEFSSIMSGNYDEATEISFLKLVKFYSADGTEQLFQDSKDAMLGELKLWKHSIRNRELTSAFKAFLSCDGEFYPRIKRLLKILCILPIITCTNERSFSTLRRLKNYLRNSMKNDRLNGLALLNTSNVKVSVEMVMDELSKKPRRLDFAI